MALNESPRDLLQSLAECLHIDRHSRTRRTTASSEIPPFNHDLKRCARRVAYEHLLFGHPRRNGAKADSVFTDPLEELGFVQFQMAFADREAADHLAKCVRQMLPEGPGDMQLGYEEQRVLTFLLGLRNVEHREPVDNSMRMVKPLMLGSLMNVRNSDYFKDRTNAPRMPFFELNINEAPNPYTNKLRLMQKQFNLPALDATKKATTKFNIPSPPPQPEPQFHRKCPSWDYLDLPLNARVPSLPFFSESPSAMLHILRKNQGASFQPLLLTTAQLIADIKLLLVGIRSETFCLDDGTISFSIRPSVSLNDGTPSVLAGAMRYFIECGTCCARLRQMCNKNADLSPKFEGFIFMALCNSVEEYLGFYEEFVGVVDDQTVCGLSNRMCTMMLQITQLSRMLAIHPDERPDSDEDVQPCGANFLGRLYKKITETANDEVAIFFLFILNECCRMYFRFFEKWIFQGILEDRSEELFIGYSECVPGTRYFWDEAYRIKPQTVPGFLQGSEELTLLCGKYTMLLKAIHPDHPLLTVHPISIDVCLTDAQTSQLRTKCLEYRKNIQTVCGPPITVQDIFNQFAQSKVDNTVRAANRLKENIARWQAEQSVKSNVLREQHAETRAILQRQISEVHDRKVQQRLESLELDRMHVANAERLEEERSAVEDQERIRRIEYYTKLGEFVDKQRSETLAKVDKLKETLQLETIKTERLATELLSDRLLPPQEDDNKNLVAETLDAKIPADELDANKNPTDALSHNRMVTQGTTFDFQHHESAVQTTNTQETAVVCLSDGNSNPVVNLEPTAQTAHQEMLQNKARVMGQQCDLFAQMDAVPTRPRVLTSNLDQMSDLQRNRFKVMTEEYCISMPPAVKASKTLQLDLVPDGPDNEVELAFATPMSTSSDTPNKTLDEELPLDASSAIKLDIPSTPTDGSSSSVYETAGSGTDSGNVFEFPTQTPQAVPLAKNPYTRSIPKIKFFEKMLVPATDQQVLDELAQPNISSITQSLRLSFTLPLKAHFNVLNSEVLKVFIVDFNLIAHFKSLRNYFFMMDGEFASHICDGLLEKLESKATPPDVLNFSFLHSLLDSALGSSIIGHDPNAVHLSFIVTDIPKRFRLDSPDVLHMLRLYYDVQWPLNLVFNTSTMAQYGTIFRYLLKLRRIRYILDQTSQRLKDVTKGAGPRCLRSPQYRYVQQIRNRLLQIINGLQNHITSNALLASWRTFKKDLERAVSIEDLCRMHSRYLDRVVFLCMLDNRKSRDFNTNLDKIWVISLRFYYTLKQHNWQFDADGIYTHPQFESLLANESDLDKCIPYILHYCEKIVQRGYQEEIADFVNVINFNGFYNGRRKIAS